MDEVAISSEAGAATRDERVFERSDTVLWTLSFPGAVLHNFARRTFLELDGTGYAVWGFLDGARPVDEVIPMTVEAMDGEAADGALEQRVREIVTALIAHGFVEERADAGR